jgi:ring-1,2-phenylacetyl-CoA epoxidase subunit PaaD
MTAALLDAAARAQEVAATVVDPEMPMLSLIDLGVLRSVNASEDGTIVVTITPTYSGCPAMATMRADLQRALGAAGFQRTDIRTSLSPAWSSDWITGEGRRKLEESGIAPPHAVRTDPAGPVPLALTPYRPMVQCPQCDSFDTEQTSAFGSTACKSLYVCRTCREPFERVKEI